MFLMSSGSYHIKYPFVAQSQYIDPLNVTFSGSDCYFSFRVISRKIAVENFVKPC